VATVTRLAIDPATFVHVVRQDRRPDPSHQLVAPSSLRTRALEVVLTEVRTGRLDDREALRLHERITEQKVRLLGDRVSRRVAWDLAREHDWKDLGIAEYLAVARLQADALVTVDERLAALAQGLVPLAPLEDLYSAG